MNLGALYLFLSALRDGELGVNYPLLALTPLFVVPVEWALMGDLPSGLAFLGIVLIVLGVYLLNFREIRSGLLAPVRTLAEDPGAKRMLVVAVVWSVGGTLDRVAVLASSAAFYSASFTAALAVLFFVLWVVLGPRDRAGIPAGAPRPMFWELLVHGLFFVCMMIPQMEAVRSAPASYVLGIKRAGAIPAVLLGYVAFREGGLTSKLTGTLITVAGILVLVWGS